MNLKWTDVTDIAIALAEAHPDVDPGEGRGGVRAR